ncbi:MAG TPA: phosphoglycerate kinase, partial [Clostridia bacterium]|nr:phosphoglycerate kinase [Clostridia bacterium]
MAKKTVEDIDVADKRVLLSVDYNVPLTQEGQVADDKRITASFPTVKYLLEHRAKLIVCSHLGRPDGEAKPEFSLAPVAERLAELLPGV